MYHPVEERRMEIVLPRGDMIDQQLLPNYPPWPLPMRMHSGRKWRRSQRQQGKIGRRGSFRSMVVESREYLAYSLDIVKRIVIHTIHKA
jgi:hypothetical protein